MSLSIFPTLPLLSPQVEKVPEWDGDDFRAPGGRRQSYLYSDRPMWRFRLRAHARGVAWRGVESEIEALWRFYNAHGGKWDSFLLRDQDDYQVSDHGFGVGNGTTTAFQLQRALTGSVSDVLGTWPLYHKRRTNYCLRSQGIDQWSKTNGGTGVAPPVTADAAVAPDGTPTADVFFLDRGAGTTVGDYSLVASPVGDTIQPLAAHIASIWLRTVDGSTKSVEISIAGAGIVLCTVTPTWQRFSSTFVAAVAYSAQVRVQLRGSGGSSQTAHLAGWGAQLEAGTTATRPIVTTTATVSVDPSYWPALGDGFEPITEPGADLALTLDGGALGLRSLVPYQRTNLIGYSDDLTGAGWNAPVNMTRARNAADPFGAANQATTLTDDATAGQHYQSGPLFSTVLGVRSALGVFLKAGTRNIAWLGVSGTAQDSIDVDLSAGTVTRTGANVSGAALLNCGAGWWRVLMATAGIASGTSRPYIGVGPQAGGAGSGQTVIAWGFDVESGVASVGDHIPTTTAAASRTDYALGANGAITLGVAPRAGAQLAWGGSFWRRVRFAQRGLSMSRLMQGLWSAEGIELEMVI